MARFSLSLGLLLAMLGFLSLCHGSDDIGSICQKLWNADTNSLLYGRDYELDIQYQLQYNNKYDWAGSNLFKKVDETKLNTPTWKAFRALLNNYYTTTGTTEVTTSTEKTENDRFLTAVMATKTMKELHKYLRSKNLAAYSESSFKFELKKMWLYFYRRNAYRDSSGFEHVFVGELKKKDGNTQVSGFHNWLQFYLEEKKPNNLANYFGFYKVQVNREPASIKIQHEWHNHLKTVTGFFLGTSPEFELAIYTACFKLKPNQLCKCNINGQTIAIKTYNMAGSYVGTAFPLV